MNKSEILFEMPVLQYDAVQFTKRETKELEAEDYTIQELGVLPYVVGKLKLPFDEIVSYMEGFEKGKTMEELNHEGLSKTVVLTETLGEFICDWDYTTFEQMLDKHEAIVEEVIKQQKNK